MLHVSDNGKFVGKMYSICQYPGSEEQGLITMQNLIKPEYSSVLLNKTSYYFIERNMSSIQKFLSCDKKGNIPYLWSALCLYYIEVAKNGRQCANILNSISWCKNCCILKLL